MEGPFKTTQVSHLPLIIKNKDKIESLVTEEFGPPLLSG